MKVTFEKLEILKENQMKKIWDLENTLRIICL